MNKIITLYVVLPCYNEALNLKKVYQDFLDVYITNKQINLSFVMVIDGCTDNTLEVAQKLKSTNDQVLIINHIINKGLGEAVKSGLNYVINNAKDNDLVVVLDSDHTHKAVYSIDMINRIQNHGFDVVIASRYFENSAVYGVPGYRIALSYFAKLYYSIMFRIPNVRDYTCGYRVYTIDILKKLYENYGEGMIRETGFSCMCELLVKLDAIGANIGESQFELFYGDKGGDSSMKVLKTIVKSLKMPINMLLFNKITYVKQNEASIKESETQIDFV